VIRFLFKSILFLTLIFVAITFLAPHHDHNSQNTKAGSYYNTFDALLAVHNTVTDLGNFCERTPRTCKTGKSFIGLLGVKARDGARIAYEFLDSQFSNAPQSPSPKTKNSPMETTSPAQSDQQKPPANKLKHTHQQQPALR